MSTNNSSNITTQPNPNRSNSRGGRGSGGPGRGRGGGRGRGSSSSNNAVGGGGGGGGSDNQNRNNNNSSNSNNNRRRKNNATGGAKKNEEKNMNDNNKDNKQQQPQQPQQQQKATTSTSGAQLKNRNRNNNRNRKKNDNNSTNKATTSSTETKKEQSTPQLSEEEIKQIEEQKLKQAQLEAIQKSQLLQQKRQQERLAKISNLDSKINTSIQDLQSLTSITNHHMQNRTIHSKENLQNTRKEFELSKKKLKSDLKKCTAFCKKIKSTLNWDKQIISSMVKDVESLNLTRYIEEIANAFMECKLKVGDVSGVVEICLALHQRYGDFMDVLLSRVLQGSLIKNSGSSGNGDDPKQKRIHLRLLLELYVNGVVTEVKPLMKILVEAAGAGAGNTGTNVNNDNSDINSYNVTDANLVVAFAKAAGHEVVGIVPKSIMNSMEFLHMEIEKAKNVNNKESEVNNVQADLDDGRVNDIDDGNTRTDTITDATRTCAANTSNNESDTMSPSVDEIIASSDLLNQASSVLESVNAALLERAFNDEICNRFHMHLMGGFKSLCSSYLVTHKKLAKLEKRCEQDRLLAGALSEQREKGLNDARKLMENLGKCVHALAEALNEEVPVLEDEENEEVTEEKIGVEVYKNQDGKDSNLGPFDDEETKAFYCDIPDLLTTIPPALLGYSAEEVEKKQEVNIQKYGSNNSEEGGNTEDPVDLNEPDTNQDFDEGEMQDAATGDIESVKGRSFKTITHYFVLHASHH